MNIRSAVVFTVVFIILVPIYLWGRPRINPNSALKEREESLLKIDGIDSVEMTRGSESLAYVLTPGGKQFRVTQPATAFIPQDLMQAMNALLTNQKDVEVVAENLDNLSEFGLDNPQTLMTIKATDRAQPIKLLFGSENPTRTAVYAEIEGVPKVFLLGRNLEYYQTLMFQWVEGKQGKNA